jgi:DNA-directed RNA polymerase specialized sigma24 family protein
MNEESIGSPEDEERERYVADLVDRTIAGDHAAWHELLVDEVEPVVEVVARRRRVTGRLHRSEEHRRNIADDVIETLWAGGFRRLRELRASAPAREGAFGAWIARVATNTAIDYVRTCPEFDRGRGRWEKVGELPEELAGQHPDPISGIDAGRILARAPQILRPRQLEALLLWLEGGNGDDIAGNLGLADARAAERLVRAALKRLRNRFAPKKSSEAGDGSPRDVVKGPLKPPARVRRTEEKMPCPKRSKLPTSSPSPRDRRSPTTRR